MTLKEGTLTRTGATFIVLNQNTVPYGWGAEFCIEKKENGEWRNVPFVDYVFPMTCMYIRKGTPTEMKINWEKHYRELENGEYRIVKGEFYGIEENGEEKLVKDNCFYGYFTIKQKTNF